VSRGRDICIITLIILIILIISPNSNNNTSNGSNNTSKVEKSSSKKEETKSYTGRIIAVIIGLMFSLVAFILLSLFVGPTGQAYSLATVATGAKTFAWWINQYPQLKGRGFYVKWLAGWSIAAFIEYLPLIGAMQTASDNGVHLGLMTAYMEALDNFFRICQQKLLSKPLAWYDLVAAGGMFLAVLFQGLLHFSYDKGYIH